MHGCIEDWENQAAGFWDTAVKGSSASRAHLYRAFNVEVATAEQLATVRYLFYVKKFYDSVQLDIRTRELERLGYPPSIF